MTYEIITSSLPGESPDWDETYETPDRGDARRAFMAEIEGPLNGGDPRIVILREVEGRTVRTIAKANLNGGL